MVRSTTLPWRKPRREAVLLALVAVTALSSIYPVSTQDVSRLCLSQAILEGHLTIQPCAGNTLDQASYGGRRYTDKAPGISVLAIPAVVATRLPPAWERWTGDGDLRVWAVRLATSGIAYLLLVFAVGRVSEGIAPGFGGMALVTFALGTIVASLAATTFDHVLAGALVFGAFLLAWSGRFALAGLLAGTAAVTSYTMALVGVVLATYVLLAGLRPLLRFAIAAAPPLVLLASYNWAAFGSPFHLSYRYVANIYSAEQAAAFFGIHAPSLHGMHLVLFGEKGLLIVSPVLVAAVAGLVLLARPHPREAITCGVVCLLLLIVNIGYFTPYGGGSPGPRFFVPALPFLALGFAMAFGRWFRATSVLAGVSIVGAMATMVTWAPPEELHYRQTIWGELVRLLHDQRSARFVDMLPKNLINVIVWPGPYRLRAAAVVCALGALTFALALLEARGARASVQRSSTIPS